MNASNQQVLTCYRELKMTPEEIAIDYGYEVESIKYIIAQDAKGAVEKAESSKLFSSSDLDAAKSTMVELLTSEVDSCRFKAAEFIINEQSGRNDAVKDRIAVFGNTNFNILMVNEALLKARQRMSEMEGKVIPMIADAKVAS